MKGKKWKPYVVGAAALLCLGIPGVRGTIGYFTGKQQVTNVFTVGDLEIALKEPEWDPQEGDGVNMCPGYSVYKNPTVKNITKGTGGQSPCYLRMRVKILDGEGRPVTSKEALELIKTTIRYDSTYTGTFDKTGKGSAIIQNRIPGYYLEEVRNLPMVNPAFELDEKRSSDNELVFQYTGGDTRGVLLDGQEAVLFTAIVIPAEWNQTQMGIAGNFSLEISAEGIQTAGFPAPEDGFAALDREESGGEKGV